MRCLMLALSLGAGVYAQTPPPPKLVGESEVMKPVEKPPEIVAPRSWRPEDNPQLYESLRKYLDQRRADAPGTGAVALPKTCAIPLTNVLKGVPPIDEDMIRRFRRDGVDRTLPMKQIPLPAPSCDDVK